MSEPQDMIPEEINARRLELARIVCGKGTNADRLAAIEEDNALAGHGSQAKARRALALLKPAGEERPPAPPAA